MTSTIWLSYDLGVRGDYEALYTWLDSHAAKECGDSLAVLSYKYGGKLVDVLKADLRKTITVDKRSRIYVIYRDRAAIRTRGLLLGVGAHRTWTGYASVDDGTLTRKSDCASILGDTGVWYAMFDHEIARIIVKVFNASRRVLDAMSVVVPWPIAYETLALSLSESVCLWSCSSGR